MNATTKRATRRIAASIAIATTLAAGGAWAANNINWTGGTGGTEVSPLDIYNKDNWSSAALPTTSDVLVFSVGAPTVLTNSMANADTTAISGGVFIQSGDYTFLGGLYSTGDISVPQLGSGSITIVKKGNWKLGRAAYFGSQTGSYCAFTNVSGNIVQTANNRWFEIGDYGTCIAENLSGDWNIAGHFVVGNSDGGRGELYWRGGNLTHTDTANPFYLACAGSASALVEKYAGNWTISNYLILSEGKKSNATFRHLGGTMKVNGTDIRLVDNGSNSSGGANFELGGGTVEAKLIQHGAGTAPATLKFDGGTFKAAAAGTIVSASDYLNVYTTSNGGTIDAGGYAVTIEEVIENVSGETGAMTFKGGGSVTLTAAPTYSGTTTVEIGTKLVVPSAPGGALAATVPSGLASGIYEVVRISGGGTFADNAAEQVTCADANATFRLSSDKKVIFCLYGMTGCVARWDFNNYDSSDPTSADVLQATIGGDGKACYCETKNQTALVGDGTLGHMSVVTTGLDAGNYAIAIPMYAHVALPIPDSVKNHPWTMKIRFYSPSASSLKWRCFFNRTNSTDGDLFIQTQDKLGGGQFRNSTGNYTTIVSNDEWHTLTVSASSSRYEAILDDAVAAYWDGNNGNKGLDYFANSSEALTDIDGVGYLLLCADNDGDDEGLMYIDYIELYNGVLSDAKYWTGFAGNGSMSDGDNWSDGVAPVAGDVLDFSNVGNAITIDADFEDNRVFASAQFGASVVTLTGSLNFVSLTNANKLAIASTGSLTVTGDLVVCDGKGTLLYSNEGTVRIGRAVCTTANGGTGTTTKQYEVVTANTQPIRTGGFLFDRVDSRVYWRLESNNDGPGAWVVGANGLAYLNTADENQMRYFAQHKPVTLYSSADWVLHACGRKAALGELYVYANSSLTIDTSDYDTPTTPHTVTLEGRIQAEGPVTIKGCGTVVVDTTSSHPDLAEDVKHTCITNGTTLSVTDTATLKINAGRKITGNGTISLAAGTKLALTADSKAFTPCIDPSVTLPAEGAATLRIDGRRLRSGEHVIATVASGTTANVTLDLASTALAGRKGTLRVEDGNLVLNIESAGLMLIVK